MVALTMILQRHADKDRCQHRKDKGLNERNQNFYTANE